MSSLAIYAAPVNYEKKEAFHNKESNNSSKKNKTLKNTHTNTNTYTYLPLSFGLSPKSKAC